ncbi:MAG: tetratricopeptide repeat protein, partial [Bacteroidetes bacterium]|nr:tetratricopeptide repeat protein [Bacteroidota bacterium]
FPQSISNYYKAMNAYNSAEFSEAVNLFQKFYKDYTYKDEMFSTAKFYESDALWKMGELDAAAVGLNYLIENFYNSNFRADAVYNLGSIYFQLKRFERSRFYFLKFSEEFNNHNNYGSALYWVGEIYAIDNKFEDAERILKQAIDVKSNNYIDYAIYSLANVYEKQADYKNAVKYYDQLLTYYKNSPLASFAQKRIGISYFYLKDYQSSILELNNPLIKNLNEKEKAQSLYLLANANYRVNNFVNAEKYYIQIINTYSSTPLVRDAKLGLAWSYFQQKKFDKAYYSFSSIKNRNDNISEESAFWAAEAKRYSGQNTKALDIYKTFVLNYPNSRFISDALYKIGVIYYSNEKYKLSERYLLNKKLTNNKRLIASAYIILGQIKLKQNQFKKAEKYFREINRFKNIDQNIKNRSDFGLSVSLFQQRRFQESLSLLLKLSTNYQNFEPNKISFYLAENNFELANYTAAVTHYKKINILDNKLYSLKLYGLGYSYFNLKDYENSAYYFNDFVKKYPKDKNIVEVKLRLADSYYGNKDFTSSSNIYNNILRGINKSKNTDYVLYQYSQALYKAGKLQQAIKEFKNLQRRFPKSKYADKSLYVIGWISFQKNNYEEAINGYNLILKEYPSSSLGPIIYYSIGDAYFNLGDYESAISSYQEILINFPRSKSVFDAVNGIQYCYVAQNNTEKAVTFLKEFVNQNPSLNFTDKLSFKIGELYYGFTDYKKAQEEYTTFTEIFPKSNLVPEAYYWIGKSAEHQKNDNEAITSFTKVYETYPQSETAAAAVIELSNIYNRLKRFDDAESVLTSSKDKLRESPRAAEIAFMLGATFVNAGDVSSAYDAFNDVITYYIRTIFAEKSKLELGLIDLSAKRYQNAEYYFRDLSENRTDDIGAKAQYYLGETLFEENNLTDAISALVRVNTVFPKYDEWVTKSFMKLGDSFVKMKDKKKARRMYRKVLNRHNKGKIATVARKKLRRIR